MGYEQMYTPPPERGAEKISNNENLGIEARVVFDKLRTEEEVPEGTEGEVRTGYAFYEVGEDDNLSDEPLTVDITDKPELVVLKEDDYVKLKDKKIIAKPVRFVWSKGGKWQIEY